MSAGWIITILVVAVILLALYAGILIGDNQNLAAENRAERKIAAAFKQQRDMAQRDLGDALAAIRGEPGATVIQWPGGAS